MDWIDYKIPKITRPATILKFFTTLPALHIHICSGARRTKALSYYAEYCSRQMAGNTLSRLHVMLVLRGGAADAAAAAVKDTILRFCSANNTLSLKCWIESHFYGAAVHFRQESLPIVISSVESHPGEWVSTLIFWLESSPDLITTLSSYSELFLPPASASQMCIYVMMMLLLPLLI